MRNQHHKTTKIIGLVTGISLLSASLLMSLPGRQPLQSYIIQGANLASVKAAVLAAGGEITHELGIIRAVGAQLSAAQLESLRNVERGLVVHHDQTLRTAATDTDERTREPPTERTSEAPVETPALELLADTAHSSLVGADALHAEGITGAGVTLAVLDTGLFNHAFITNHTGRLNRIAAHYDAIEDQELAVDVESDASGHGAHVASISVNSSISDNSGGYRGIAPDAGLVIVRAFDAAGQASYADVIRGIDWLVEHKGAHDVRVLNLSFSAPPQSHYWDDPLNQAVMAAWQAGIVVVASAGNTGPEPMTIGAPGNVPYVITVGATTDNYTPDDPSRRWLGVLLLGWPDP